MKTVKKKHAPIDFKLPTAAELVVTSVSGKSATLAELRALALTLTNVPSGHALEDDLQADAFMMYKDNFRQVCYGWHTPNGGHRDEREAVQLKGQGVVSGVPDLMFMTHGFRMIFVELKCGHYRYDPNQALFARKALDYGFADVFLCGTLREVAALLCHIFDIVPSSLIFRA